MSVRTKKYLAGLAAGGLAAVVLAACGGGAGSISSTGSTGSVAQGNSSAPSTTTTTDPSSGLTVVGQGFTQLPPDSIGNSYANEAAVLKWNGTDTAADQVEVTLTLTDASGTVVNSAQENVAAIFPGQTVAVSNYAQASGAANMKVQALVTKTQSYSSNPPTLLTSGVNTTSDGFDQQTTGTVTSTASVQLQNVQAVAVYYNGGGQILGGGDTFVNFVPAGGNTSFQISGIGSIPEIASTQVFVSVSNLTLSALSQSSPTTTP